MFLTGRNHMIINRSVFDTIKLLHGFGYKGMELSINRGLTKILAFDYMDDYVVNSINELCDKLGFPICALACHQSYVGDDLTFDAQKKLLRTARKYGTDVVIMSTPADLFERENHPEMYDELAKRTRELCNIAEEEGVNIAIEVEPNQLVHNMKRFYELVDRVKSPSLKLNFDVGHIYLSEVDLFKAIDECKDFIVYSHIENMVMGEHCHKLPWEGDIDLLAVYKKLAESGYNSAVSLDIYLQDYEAASPKCIEYINNEIFSKI